MSKILELADAYAYQHRWTTDGDSAKARTALQAEVEKLEADLDNKADIAQRALAERDALRAENERLQAGYLHIRKALGLDLHSNDNLLVVIDALRAQVASQEAVMRQALDAILAQQEAIDGVPTGPERQVQWAIDALREATK